MAEALTLPSTAESVPRARRFVRGALDALGAGAAGDDAEMLVCELATNAVLHARTEYTIEVERRGGSVRVRVHDSSVVLPRQRSYGVDSTTGRGIRLLASIASDWGIDVAAGSGKAVWFDLPVDGSAADVPAWDEDLDVAALLAAYDDDVATDVGPTLLAAA